MELSWRTEHVTSPNGSHGGAISFDTIKGIDSLTCGHSFGYTFNFPEQTAQAQSFMPPWKQVFSTGQGHIQTGVILKNRFIAISRQACSVCSGRQQG